MLHYVCVMSKLHLHKTLFVIFNLGKHSKFVTLKRKGTDVVSKFVEEKHLPDRVPGREQKLLLYIH